ncbi:MAG: hypothetical protein KC777_23045 [Cyanobacteria bacterium HKST-UBA02]|nr:hypothetical protein [Cyanobacteria bacterium HKST-UBA02]
MSRDSILENHNSSNDGGIAALSINSLSLDDFRQYKSTNRDIAVDGAPPLKLVDGLEQTEDSPLSRMNEAITSKAEETVRGSMSPAEKAKLSEDSRKYGEDQKHYEEEMRTAMMQNWLRGPDDWPKAPAKPESMVRYEAAVQREITAITRGLKF